MVKMELQHVLYIILSRFRTAAYHVVFDELLKKTGHGSHIIVWLNILKYRIVKDHVTAQIKLIEG